MSASGPAALDVRHLSVFAIERPPRPMRESWDDDALQGLAGSIRDIGLMQPIGVYERDGRFVIIYGHRRFEATLLAGETTIPARVHVDGGAREEDFKFAENYHREPVNPIEEASWLAQVIEERHGGAIEPLARALGVTVSYIDGRLELLHADERVQAALRAGKINLAVARELAKIKHRHYLAFVLDDAINEGLTAAAVQAKRLDIERTLRQQEIAAAGGSTDIPPAAVAAYESVDVCLSCESPSDPLQMVRVPIHKSCLEVLMRARRDKQRADGD